MRANLGSLALAAISLWSVLAVPAGAEDSCPLGPQAIADYYSQSPAEPLGPAGGSPASRNVEVIINSSLYSGGQIAAGLNQYIQDIRNQGYNPTLTTTSFANAGELRAHLAGSYSSGGLAGAVLIGSLPAATYEIAAHGSWAYESFPSDLYYQDLDGLWNDADGNGRYDQHTGNVAPEIWVGRLLTHSLTSLHPGRSEAGMLNSYFARNHAYRTGQLSVAPNGLSYVDDDWIGFSYTWTANLKKAVSGAVTLVDDGPATIASDYKSRLQTEYEHVLLCAHSSATSHSFKIDSLWTGGSVLTSELMGLDPQVLFYNLFACSNARFTSNGYMAGEYVFGTDMGLLSVGSAKTGSMLEFQDYFTPLGQGATFGEAWKSWWLGRAAGGFSTNEKDWHYGMAMIGDPLLMTQQFIPEPASVIAMMLAGLALLRRRSRRRPR